MPMSNTISNANAAPNIALANTAFLRKALVTKEEGAGI